MMCAVSLVWYDRSVDLSRDSSCYDDTVVSQMFPEFVAWQVAGNISETSISAGVRQREHLIDRVVFRRCSYLCAGVRAQAGGCICVRIMSCAETCTCAMSGVSFVCDSDFFAAFRFARIS
jgi:hypothetical protein